MRDMSLLLKQPENQKRSASNRDSPKISVERKCKLKRMDEKNPEHSNSISSKVTMSTSYPLSSCNSFSPCHLVMLKALYTCSNMPLNDKSSTSDFEDRIAIDNHFWEKVQQFLIDRDDLVKNRMNASLLQNTLHEAIRNEEECTKSEIIPGSSSHLNQEILHTPMRTHKMPASSELGSNHTAPLSFITQSQFRYSTKSQSNQKASSNKDDWFIKSIQQNSIYSDDMNIDQHINSASLFTKSIRRRCALADRNVKKVTHPYQSLMYSVKMELKELNENLISSSKHFEKNEIDSTIIRENDRIEKLQTDKHIKNDSIVEVQSKIWLWRLLFLSLQSTITDHS